MSQIEIVIPTETGWSPYREDAPGYAGQTLFRYSPDRLGVQGVSGPYTVLNRFGPGAAYPAVCVLEQPVEVCVTKGTLLINDTAIPSGSWARVMPHDTDPVVFSSRDGCEIISIVRGRICLAERAKASL